MEIGEFVHGKGRRPLPPFADSVPGEFSGAEVRLPFVFSSCSARNVNIFLVQPGGKHTGRGLCVWN